MLDATLNPTAGKDLAGRAMAGLNAMPIDHDNARTLVMIIGTDPSLEHAIGHAERKIPAWIADWTGQTTS